MVISKDDHLVGSTTVRAGGATPYGDSSTPAKGNRSEENISAKL
jgi:hypothetical protein